MSDPRRYYDSSKSYMCPECRSHLLWKGRGDKRDSLILVHPLYGNVDCSRSGKKYYPPAIELTEFTELPVDA